MRIWVSILTTVGHLPRTDRQVCQERSRRVDDIRCRGANERTLLVVRVRYLFSILLISADVRVERTRCQTTDGSRPQ
jgi:hypothetical protein